MRVYVVLQMGRGSWEPVERLYRTRAAAMKKARAVAKMLKGVDAQGLVFEREMSMPRPRPGSIVPGSKTHRDIVGDATRQELSRRRMQEYWAARVATRSTKELANGQQEFDRGYYDALEDRPGRATSTSYIEGHEAGDLQRRRIDAQRRGWR